VGSGLKGEKHVRTARGGGDHGHPGRGEVLPNGTKARGACHAGHGEIEERQSDVTRLCKQLNRLIKRASFDDLSSSKLLPQDRTQRHAEELIIIGHKVDPTERSLPSFVRVGLCHGQVLQTCSAVGELLSRLGHLGVASLFSLEL
jgi:hypothetical protein